MRKSKTLKVIVIFLCSVLIFQQTGFAQVASVELNIAGHFAALHNTLSPDKFRPVHLRYISYDGLNNNFKLLLDKGDQFKGLSPKGTVSDLESVTKDLLTYFFTGISLPNDTFWVNLRPDSPNDIIDPLLAQTEVGKILLEADLQLKKDTANATNPQTSEGKEYWNKLYQKAGELYGSQNVTIPTLTRPWIVPDEIIIRESTDSAYVYKATLKVMLEQDYLKGNVTYSFKDPRQKELNEYSSQIIREKILPKLTKDINNAKRYAPLRQVYYSLILAQWFKATNQNKNTQYSRLINRKDLSNLQSKTPYSVATYFNAYKDNFEKGEYKIQEPVYTPNGQVIRSYFSGGITGIAPEIPIIGQPISVNPVGTKITVVPEKNDPNINNPNLTDIFPTVPELTLRGYEQDIEEAEKREEIIITPDLLEDPHGSSNLSGANTRPFEGEELLEVILNQVVSPQVPKVLALGPGAGAEIGDMYRMGVRRGRMLAIDTVSLSPIAPRFLMTQDAESKLLEGKGEISLSTVFRNKEEAARFFEVLQKPFIRTQYIGPLLSTQIPTPGKGYNFIYDNLGAFLYSSIRSMPESLAKVLNLLDPENGIFLSTSTMVSDLPQDDIPLLKDYVVISWSAKSMCCIVNKNSIYAQRFREHQKGKISDSDFIYSLDYDPNLNDFEEVLKILSTPVVSSQANSQQALRQNLKSLAEQLLGRAISEKELDAIQKAHEIGQWHYLGKRNSDGTYEKNEDPDLAYMFNEIAQKARVLKEAGFSEEERRVLMKNGIVGNNPETQSSFESKVDFSKALEFLNSRQAEAWERQREVLFSSRKEGYFSHFQMLKLQTIVPVGEHVTFDPEKGWLGVERFEQKGATQGYWGPTFFVHGNTKEGKFVINDRPASELINRLHFDEGINSVLLLSCNPFDGELGDVVIPVIYASGTVDPDGDYMATTGGWKTKLPSGEILDGVPLGVALGISYNSLDYLKERAEQILKRTITEQEFEAVKQAHEIGKGHSLGTRNADGTYNKHVNNAYTTTEIAQKARILKSVGFTLDEREKLIQFGIVGSLESIDNLGRVSESGRENNDKSTLGGIDFRFLPIVTQSMDNLRVSIQGQSPAGTVSTERYARINLIQEWSDIERLVNSGITPSAERLKDYLVASCFKGNLDIDMERIVSCISNILRTEEESCCSTDPTLKDILVVLGSGRSGQELKLAFAK